MDGFDLNSPLVCEGIIGDGCGGGRIFFVEEETLYAYDPITKEKILLLKNIKEVKSISKSKCFIMIKCKNKVMQFDLSALKLI